MSMAIFRVLGIAISIVGIILLVLGIVATQNTSESIVHGVTGEYTNKTVWYIIGGIALILGGAGLTRIRK